ncbi:MAG: putative mucin/carbohydrate-binding domain-containing protein [[Clostridium] innocuum]
MKMRLTTRNVTPHSYFSGSYEKIEVLDTTNVVVYTKDFNGKQRLEAGIEDIPFAVGYKIRLSGSEQDFRVKAYQDDNPSVFTAVQNKATQKD